MASERDLSFGSYRLDVTNQWLWRGTQPLRLTSKAFAVLQYLVAHAGQLVTRRELFQAVWPGITVSDAALAVCVREVRKVLGDDAKTPQFIETVHRRGYRFLPSVTPSPPVVSCQLSVVSKHKTSADRSQLATDHWQLPTRLVGRAAELAQLHRWLAKALNGERQLVFVTGEAGIGKTTVVEAFLDQVRATAPVWLARGQCIEHYGAGEAYLPMLEALGQLCREEGRERVVEILNHQAPSWLVQMPAVLSRAEAEELQRKIQGTTRERMLREMAEALEAVAAEQPLVLLLEDLHCSDYATLDLLSALARRRQSARLLVIGTYRPVEMIVSEHPLRAVKQELQLHGLCEELPLRLLTEEEVAEYLAERFVLVPDQQPTFQRIARLIHRRTDGNPLFMVNVVEYLIAQGVLVTETVGRWTVQRGLEEVEVGVPESLRQMIEKQLERLTPQEQRLLEAASVAGVEFSAATLAAALAVEVEEVEEKCHALVRRDHFLRSSGVLEWPDGTVGTRYSFLHALYQEVLYERVTAAKRVRLHQCIGEREEMAYGNRVGERAAELAVHFERGRDYRRAVQYLEQAALNASQRSASMEVIQHLTRGLALLQQLPKAPERLAQDLTLHIALGAALMATKGYGAAEVETAYARARELCKQVGETPQLCPVLFGLCAFYLVRAEYETARELGEHFLRLAQSIQNVGLLLEAHLALGQPLLWLGELTAARAHFEQVIALYDPHQHRDHAFLYGQDPGIDSRHWAAQVLWSLGYPDQAWQRSCEALALAGDLSHSFSRAATLTLLAGTHQLRREAGAAQARAEQAITLSREQGFELFAALGTLLHGWALAELGNREEGISQLRAGLTAWQATGAELGRPYNLALLAEAQAQTGQITEALALLGEALATVQRTGERWWEAELYRLKGELILKTK